MTPVPAPASDPPRFGHLLFRARLGVPWVTILLVATCFVVTAPLVVSPRRFYLTYGAGFCEETIAPIRWFHHLVTHFVHGAGCGFPPIWFHLGANTALFVFQGALVERLLGSGRVALLAFSCLGVQAVLEQALLGGPYAHGASGMTWAYLLFVLLLIREIRREGGWAFLREWTGWVTVLLAVFGVAGLVNRWHAASLIVSIPFFVAWREKVCANVRAALGGGDLDRGKASWNRAGVAAAAVVLVVSAGVVIAAVAGLIRPAM